VSKGNGDRRLLRVESVQSVEGGSPVRPAGGCQQMSLQEFAAFCFFVFLLTTVTSWFVDDVNERCEHLFDSKGQHVVLCDK